MTSNIQGASQVNNKKLGLKLNIPTRKVLALNENLENQKANKCNENIGNQINTQPMPKQKENKVNKKEKKEDGHSSQYSETASSSPQNILFQSSSKFYEKYRIVMYIDGGTSAVVEKCQKISNSQPYAVKRTKCEPEQILDLKQSFTTIKLLKHPNIIKYHSLYISPSHFKSFLVMQYFPHPPLSNHPDFFSPCSPDPHVGFINSSTPCYSAEKEQKLQKIIHQILSAVSYMHKIGICHRDIKPQNILYDDSSQTVKVIDFGVSREIGFGGSKKIMMTCTGTTEYKAPELFKAGFYDQLIDQWAVGITLYKLIAGKNPFISVYYKQTLQNIENCNLQFKEQVWQHYNPFVKDLIKSLVCPRQTRITAQQAQNSLWFKNGYKQFYQSMNISGKKKEKEANPLTQTLFIDKKQSEENSTENKQKSTKKDRKNMLQSLSLSGSINDCQQVQSDYDYDDSEDDLDLV